MKAWVVSVKHIELSSPRALPATFKSDASEVCRCAHWRWCIHTVGVLEESLGLGGRVLAWQGNFCQQPRLPSAGVFSGECRCPRGAGGLACLTGGPRLPPSPRWAHALLFSLGPAALGLKKSAPSALVQHPQGSCLLEETETWRGMWPVPPC